MLLRRRLAGVVVLAIVGSLLFGGSIAALAGARRSSSALDRFLAYSRPEDLFVTPAPGSTIDAAEVARLPQVAATAYASYVAMVPADDGSAPDVAAAGDINPYLYTPVSGPPDAILHRRILHGRDLDPASADEIVIDEELAAARHLAPGDRLRMATYSAAQLEALFASPTVPQPEGPVVDLEVTGIVRLPADVHPAADIAELTYGGTQDLYLSPGFYRHHGQEVAVYNPPEPTSGLSLLLRQGAADVPAVEAGLRSVPGGRDAAIETGGSDALDAARRARRAIGVETTSLAALGVALAVAGLVLVGHGFVRLARELVPDLTALRVVGLRPRELTRLAALPAVLAGLVAGLGAAGVAVVASPLTPIGLGRQAEVAPGLHPDVMVVGLGVTVLLLLALVLPPIAAGHVVRSVAGSGTVAGRPPSRLGDQLARIGAPLGATLGARFATEPPGLRRAPLRYASGVSALALLTVAGVATYSASLEHLAHNPGEQGASWDLTLGNPNSSDFTPEDGARLLAHDGVAGVAQVISPEGRGSVDGADVAIAGLDVLAGPVGPRPTAGRLPVAEGEVLLGVRTAAKLRVGVGDVVEVRMNGTPAHLTVTGIAVLNPGLAFTMELGDGAVVSTDQLRALLPDAPVNILLATLDRGTSVDAAIASLGQEFPDVARPAPAVEVLNLRRVRSVPVALAGVLAVAALGLVVVASWTSTRDRRGDVVVLRALGATRRQVAAALAWQGTWLYGAALVGLPLGVAAGRILWSAVLDQVGALSPSQVPFGVIGLVAVAGGILMLLVHGAPALRAARATGANRLRVE